MNLLVDERVILQELPGQMICWVSNDDNIENWLTIRAEEAQAMIEDEKQWLLSKCVYIRVD